ncbi:major facilitator superfamily MFS_1 [Kribbella flavida DSM 17836]|uniref:Major facilitator superfamily MFS_1 n=1 Tax=Kribbella flavida (strain DSM 17836 / JCM 10339 / NBRC 14399) TaxID=479435 RepID=D2Q3W8_KRIFD|nr:MFS transporter [Kribbella flavida]ADB35990.1 major facilitator superfamily MFS_1 [Kribbella flavida DSM 17836]
MLIPLVLAAAAMNAAMVAASAVSTILVADELAPALGGLPNTAGVLGTAAGAVAVGRLSARSGRAHALRVGYAVAVCGAALTTLSAVGAHVALLFIGMLLLGAGNAASLLSRYAAADAVDPARQARAMSAVVWASTAGAVGGPFLLEPAGRVAGSMGLPAISGAFLLAVVAAFGAVMAASRIKPTGSGQSGVPVAGEPEPGRADRSTTVIAAAVMIVGQLAMVALMTAVPVHVHQHGQGMTMLGAMLSAHTFGMFALAPVTGWLIDRWQPRPVMLAGLATLAGAALAVALPLGWTLTPALFLLGYGWNLCYLGGSASLARQPAGSAAARSRRESRVEAWVWGVSALATAASTLLFAAGGFPLVTTVSLALAVPLLAVVAARKPVAGRPEASNGIEHPRGEPVDMVG